jgi:transcriptional regulator with XRE-family HTH domain
MIDSFGSRLRHHRERRQISLAEIAARTKIKASLFEALERDDISQWPAGIFGRSFMRAYAVAIGLEPEQMVREFLEQFPDADTGQATASVPAEPGAVSPPTLRLTLAETGRPFTAGPFLRSTRQRCSAVAWDLGLLLAIALTVFVVADRFWMPLGITSLCYYLGGIALLGNTPGVCLFAPKPADEVAGALRVLPPRSRPRAEPAPRHVARHVNPFRSVRRSGATRT